MGQRVVLEPGEFQQFESRCTSPRRDLGGPNQPLVLVSAFGDEARHVFRSDDGE